jgi:hypothetical protein
MQNEHKRKQQHALFDQLKCGEIGTLVIKGDKDIAFTHKNNSES